MRKIGQIVILALLAVSQTSEAQFINGVQFTEGAGEQIGNSRIIFPSEVDGTAKCGITSKFWGKQEDGATIEGRVISDLSPETICNGNLTGAILLWPNRLWELNDSAREAYPCGENFNKMDGKFFLDFYANKGVKGIVFAGDIPNSLSSLGFLYTDDLGFSRTAYKSLDFFIFECAFPSNWESVFMRESLNSTVTASFTMEADLAFRHEFASGFYLFLFSIFMPLAHIFVCLAGIFSLYVHVHTAKKSKVMAHVPMTAIFVNVSASFILAFAMFFEGWWRTGNYSSLLRDSFSDLFIGPLAGSGLLIVVVWADFVAGWKRGMARVTKPLVARYRGRLVAMGVCMFSIPITTTVLIVTRTVRLIDVQIPLVGFLVLVELVLTAFFLTQSRKFTALVLSMIGSKETHMHKSDSAMLQICKLVRYAGFSLAYLIFATGLMATDLVSSSPTAWTILWFNYHFSRVLAGFAMIRVASKNKKVFTRQLTTKIVTTSTKNSSTSSSKNVATK